MKGPCLLLSSAWLFGFRATPILTKSTNLFRAFSRGSRSSNNNGRILPTARPLSFVTCYSGGGGCGGGCDDASSSDATCSSSNKNDTTTTTTVSLASSFSSRQEDENDHHEWIQDVILYDNWRRLIDRQVRLPTTKRVAHFEIVSQKGTDQAVIVFAWNSTNKTVTMISEYMPSVHKHLMGHAAGMIDDKHLRLSYENDENEHQDRKHAASLTAAQFELEEECRLTGGRQWIRLTEEPVVMDKYSTTKMMVYLVLDPVSIDEDKARPRDATEEGMHIVTGVTVDELRRMIRGQQRVQQPEGGRIQQQLTVVGSWASLLALDKLRELGEILD